MSDTNASSTTSTKSDAAVASTPALEDAKALASYYDGQLATIRKAADLAGKTLATLATTAAAALGVTKLSSVFPQPPGVQWGWFAALYLGLVVALAGVAIIAVRLWSVGQPIPSQSDEERMSVEADLDPDELRVVRAVYNDVAKLHGVGSLLAYEARGYRLERAAERLQDPAADGSQLTTNLLAQAATIRAEVHAAQTRASYLVARRRTSRVFTDWFAGLACALFAGGLIAVSASDSYLAARGSHPNQNFTLAQDCADLTKAVRDAGAALVNNDCNAVITATMSTTTTTSATTSTSTSTSTSVH
jgi:hypothetical protein